ncbi:MAG: flagellar hook-length control protein FliK, partial [Gemmatimonas sp.]
AAGEGARAGAPAAPLQAFDRTVSAAVSDLIGGELAGTAWRTGGVSGLPGPRGDTGNAANPAAAQATLAASGASLDPGRALQFAPLGPGIDLMVGPEPEPAMQDLLEFARASGIGADALERLFGPQASTGSRLGGGVSQTSLNTQKTQTAITQQTPQALPAPLPGTSASTLVAPPWLAAASRVDARVDGASARPRSASFDVDGVDALLAPTAASGERSDVPASPVLSSAAAPSSAAAQPAPAQAVAGAAVPPVSYAEMSHRVAQAVASRMVAGLREGSGSLRLQLEPQSLGRVEVQMALQDGRLEATIAAHQAGTRDLLTDGIVRLRETLGQLGMNVAVINVIDGSGGRGDGKPTRQRPGDTAYSRQGAGAGRVEGASEAGRPSRGVSGLDVWA